MAPEIRPIWRSHRHYFFAVGGAIIGGVSVFVVMTVFDGWLSSKRTQSAEMATTLVTAPGRALKQSEQLIGILEEIAAEESKGQSGTSLNSSEYQKCLSDCDGDFGGTKQTDECLLINCRKECIALYAEHVKEIRRRYHRDKDGDQGKEKGP